MTFTDRLRGDGRTYLIYFKQVVLLCDGFELGFGAAADVMTTGDLRDYQRNIKRKSLRWMRLVD